MELNKVYNEDCLIGMQRIPDKSVDMILCDLPYGTTASAWDIVIPFEPLWEQYRRIIKDKGAILLFGSEPFSSMVRMSAFDLYKYDWIWYKNMPTGHTQAKNKPLKDFENVMVFSKGTTVHATQSENRMNYYPQGLIDVNIIKSNSKKFGNINGERPSHKETYTQNKSNYPRMTLTGYNLDKDKLHPNQKPVALLEYLIKTYSLEDEVIMDNCMGVFSTAIACIRTGRNYIGFEKDKEKKYFEKGLARIEKHIKELNKPIQSQLF